MCIFNYSSNNLVKYILVGMRLIKCYIVMRCNNKNIKKFSLLDEVTGGNVFHFKSSVELVYLALLSEFSPILDLSTIFWTLISLFS